MARLSPLPFRKLGRRPVEGRLLVHFRARPDTVATLAPDARPKLIRGYALLAVCYTRFGGVGRWLPRGAPQRLSYHLALEHGHWALERFERDDRRFEFEDTRFKVALTVLAGEEEELHLAGETCALPTESVFANGREAAAFLAEDEELRPGEDRALEPLAVRALRHAFPADALPSDVLEFDSAFRLVNRRAQPAPSEAKRARLEPGTSSASALPSV